jgi:nitrite reductase/ring-hydroxylating ferredoxin subunit
MNDPVFLCTVSDIEDPGSRGFEVGSGRRVRELFVVHRDGEYHGYINSCPHTGVNLEWQEDRFLDMDKSFIQCSTHDALFEIDTGLCIAGPCVGDRLTPVELVIEDSRIYALL